ncbi:MAG TPA: hypothetical protein PKV73_18525 [Agriterribacter sp.]|nr:hypothetical protein [Agriterribacter sp.]
MNQLNCLFTCILVLSSIAGCISNQHNISSIQPQSTESRILSSIRDKALKDADYHCKYSKLAESEFARYIIDPELFRAAYQTTHGFKASDHLYTTGQAQGLLREKENKVQRITQLQKMRGQGNQIAIQELNREIVSIDQLLRPAHLNKALMEHQDLERKWINKAISHIAQLRNLDITYQVMAEFDVELEKYGRMCSDWKPSYYGDKLNFPNTAEKADIAHLRKAVEDKMYVILMSGDSSIADQIDVINTNQDVYRFFNKYIILNGGASTNALVRAGVYNNYMRRNNLAKVRGRK